MGIPSNIKTLIQVGYRQHCEDIKLLVDKRINCNNAEILDDYIKEQRGYVESYCIKNNIDLVSIITGSEEDKAKLGLSLIENKIMAMLGSKCQYDSELKSLNIKTERILNGIENAPWLVLFGSPNNLAWFVKRTDKVVENLDPNDEWYEYIVETISNIKDNWIDPQSLKPDLEKYWFLMNLPVDEEVKERVVFPSGN